MLPDEVVTAINEVPDEYIPPDDIPNVIFAIPPDDGNNAIPSGFVTVKLEENVLAPDQEFVPASVGTAKFKLLVEIVDEAIFVP
jgi:hypothetical protein